MSASLRPIQWKGTKPDPFLTIDVVGVHDIYRFADHLERGQVEFAEMGRKIKDRLRRKLTAEQWEWLIDYMHGEGGHR